jgi:hypothetical protein
MSERYEYVIMLNDQVIYTFTLPIKLNEEQLEDFHFSVVEKDHYTIGDGRVQ